MLDAQASCYGKKHFVCVLKSIFVKIFIKFLTYPNVNIIVYYIL